MPATVNPAANPSASDYAAPLATAGPLRPAPDWPSRAPPPADNPIAELIGAARSPAPARHSPARQAPVGAGASSALLAALVALSLVVSVALVWLVVAGCSSQSALGSSFPEEPSKLAAFDK